MGSAWTARLRTERNGTIRCQLIPAAGMGFSEPCCTEGHPSEREAAEHGAGLLVLKLSPDPKTITAAA